MDKKTTLAAAALAALSMAAGCAKNGPAAGKTASTAPMASGKGECYGINTCKGTGECGGVDGGFLARLRQAPAGGAHPRVSPRAVV